MDSIDSELARNYLWMLDNDVESLQQEMSYNRVVLGVLKTYHLSDKVLTNENKKEFIKNVCNIVMTDSIKEQILAFLEGFDEVIPKETASLLSEKELGLQLAGMPHIESKG